MYVKLYKNKQIYVYDFKKQYNEQKDKQQLHEYWKGSTKNYIE